MIDLSIPYILLILLLALVFLAVKKKYIITGLIAFIIFLINSHWQVYSFNGLFSSHNDREAITVLSFNIDGSGYHSKLQIQDLADFIVRQDADILFLAEDFNKTSIVLDSLLSAHYVYSNYRLYNQYGGHYFYSKYPLGSVEHLEIESNRFSYCYHCKVAYQNDSINLFGVHMASNNYKGHEASIRPEDIDGVSSLSSYFDNIELASKQRCEEAKVIIEKSKVVLDPIIIMGDFNDVCGSKPLNILEDTGFKDAWWEGGFGYGATIHHPLPFRIDHIIYNDGLDLVDIKKVDSQGLSDHDALVASFRIKK